MKRYFSFLLLITAVGFTSCLKQDPNLNPDQSPSVVEIFNEVPSLIASPTSGPFPLYIETFPISAGEDFTVFVNYAGKDVAPQDIKLTLGLDITAIDKYNTANSEAYVVLPATKYTVDSWDVTIPKGSKRASIKFKLKTDAFDFAEAYVLPIKIMSTSFGTISGNYGTTLFSVGAKNAYDGVYQYKTSAVTSLRPNSDVEVELWTLSATSVSLQPGLLGYYGNVVNYTVNASTNAVTVECPSLGVQTPQDTRSKYDPATKSFKIYWKQGNGGRTFEETLTFKKDR